MIDQSILSRILASLNATSGSSCVEIIFLKLFHTHCHTAFCSTVAFGSLIRLLIAPSISTPISFERNSGLLVRDPVSSQYSVAFSMFVTFAFSERICWRDFPVAAPVILLISLSGANALFISSIP